ncbi:DNA primase, partial [Streptomyces sp. NPDC058632]
MNRVGLGLAVGAGYLLGRTRKLKLAVAVGTMVAGKKMNLTPKGIAELVTTQLQHNPQFKEIGDQLRTDFRGMGKAASGALVERQIGTLADRLHGRTAQVRDQLSGVVSQVPGVGSDDSRDSRDSRDSQASEGSVSRAGDELCLINK